MIRKSDVQWWLLEAKKHPESAPVIIEELAKRLTELDAENERLRDEIIQLQRRTSPADNAELSALRDRVATLQALLDGKGFTEPSVVFLSDRLQSARMPLSQVRQLALADEGRSVPGSRASLGLNRLLLVRPNDELLLLTSQGRGLKVQPSDVPWLAEEDDWPTIEGAELVTGERLTAALAVTEPPRFWTVVTRRGYVRQFLRISFDRGLAQGDQVVESSFHNDAPVSIVNGDQGDLLVLTRWGKGVRFSQRSIEGPGSVALEMEPDDEVVTALPLPSDIQVLIVTAAGFAARRDTAKFGVRSRPGGTGKSLIQAFDVLGAFPYDPQAQLLYLTYSGKLALVPVADISLHTRSRKGSRLRVFDRDPAVAVALIPGTP